MSIAVLSVLVLLPTWAVVGSLFALMWHERRSRDDARTAIVAGTVLSVWAAITTSLAAGGAFIQSGGRGVPPVGIAFALLIATVAASLLTSASLRRVSLHVISLRQLVDGSWLKSGQLSPARS